MAWSVGQLARACGLTVRTLHHYDEIGLLVPRERTGAGHRRYSDEDVERLYRITALRRIGLPLSDIADLLESDGDLRDIARRHLEHVEREIARGERVRVLLQRIIDAQATRDDLIDLIEETTMHEKYYTREQLDQLAERADALGPGGLEKAQQDWADLIAQVDAERQAGTDAGDPKLKPLMERWQALIESFTGGDPGIAASLNRMYEEEGVKRASRGAMSSELADYVKRVSERQA
jgi:DNA-binding transcriptional MerR regulator